MPLFTPPPLAPQRGDRATFSQRVDAFLTWLVQLIPQLNDFIAGLNSRNAGGANTFTYSFDSATSDVDPGEGKLRLGSSAQSASNVLRIDLAADGGVDISSILDSIGAVSSNVKGSVRLQKSSDVTAFMIFDVTSVINAGGYRNLMVTPRASSSMYPFSNGDLLSVFFDRNGDKGDGGGTPSQQDIRNAIGILGLENGGTGSNSIIGARATLGVPSTSDVVLKDGMNVSTGTRLVSGAAPGIANMNGSNGNEDKVPLIIGNNNNAGASALIQFVRTGQHAVFFGLDTDNKIKLGGYSLGAVAYEIWHQGNFNPSGYAQLSGAAFTGNVSAPKFTATSDESLKENWRAIPDDFLERFAAIERAGLFDWSDSGETDGGIGAQSIREIAPWCVVDVDGKLSVNHAALNTVVSHALARRVLRNEAMQ